MIQGDNRNGGQRNVRSYGCAICNKPGHRYKMCPQVLDYGTPLDLKDRNVRERLCERLVTLKSDIRYRFKGDQRTIMKSYPPKTIGVIIHARYWKTPDSTMPKDPSDMCLECTFICSKGKKSYCSCLFNLAIITHYIQKSLSNIVVTKL